MYAPVGVRHGPVVACLVAPLETRPGGKEKMRAAGRTEPPSCTARVACLREMAANLRCTSHPFCLRRGPGGKGTGGSVIARSTGRSRVPLRERFGLRLGSVVPSNDELFVGDVERACDVTVVGELHEPRDDAGHLCFRSPRRWVPSRRRGGEWRAVPAGSPEVVVRNKRGGKKRLFWHHEETKFDCAIRGNLRLLALS